MQLCDAHGLPLLSLVDTPGIMVGPDAEATGTVRHASRLFVTGASLTVPVFAIILRKGYGLGAQAMCGGSFHVPFFTLAWPTGEFGAMGLEGAVRLGFRKELAAAENDEVRQALFEKMVAHVYKEGKALNTASFMELDEVIDPLETRARIVAGLRSAHRGGGKRPLIDTW
jgi:acetyl-CoA carboxylase carboxyltransferase component